MRLRHIAGDKEQVAQSAYVIQEPLSRKGRWSAVFGNENPIELEIGMGKGKFLMELAAKNADTNYVGVERYSSVLVMAIKKRKAAELPNLWFLNADARELAEIFAQGEVEKIYLNFSDPWPKERHAKRRLTSPGFMAVYDKILKEGGSVEFKTDNRELFDYSLESISQAGWRIRMSTLDLHHSPWAEGNVMTEYEAKFSSQGKPIYKLIADRDKGRALFAGRGPGTE